MNIKHTVKFTDKIFQESELEDLRLILSQCELKNKGTNENADSLYQKGLAFLSISITALSGLVIYISDRTPNLSALYVICWVIIVLLTIICCKLKGIVMMSTYYGMGAHPVSLVDEDFYTDLNGKSPEWYLIQRLVVDYEKRIVINEKRNARRARILRQSVGILYWIPGQLVCF